MARPLRIEYPGAWYHVMNRGRRKEKIFWEARDYRTFLHLLGKCFELFELEIHAFSLMPNHYHLLVRTPRGNLSRAMRHLDGVYTQKVNRRYGHDGVLFRGRYKAILVDADSYAMELVRYIHRNPIKEGMGRQAWGHHSWTSHRYYLRKEGRPEWLQREFLLKYFGTREKEAVLALDAFVKGEPERGLVARLESVKWPAMLGGESFKEWARQQFLGKRLDDREVPELREALREKKITELQELACGLWGRTIEDWRKVRRGFEDLKRRALIYASRRHLKATSREIREAFGGIRHSAISTQYRKAEEEICSRTGCFPFVQELENSLNRQTKT